VQDIAAHGSIGIHSPAQSPRISSTGTSMLSTLAEDPSNLSRLSTSQALLTQPSGIASSGGKDRTPFFPLGKQQRTTLELADIIHAGAPDVILAAGIHSTGMTGNIRSGVNSTGGSVLESSGSGMAITGASETPKQETQRSGEPVTSADVSVMMPSFLASSSFNYACSQKAVEGGGRGGSNVRSCGTADSVLESSHVHSSGAVYSSNGAMNSSTSQQHSRALRSITAWGKAAKASAKQSPSRPTYSTACAADNSPPTTEAHTSAGGSSAPPSSSGLRFKGATSSHTGEHFATHDSGVPGGLVMLGEGGEPVLFHDAEHDNVADPQETDEDLESTRQVGQSSMRWRNNEAMAASVLPLAPVDSDIHSAMFRAMTPAETLRQQQPGWRQSQEGSFLDDGYGSHRVSIADV
jgi:hypothetical protein